MANVCNVTDVIPLKAEIAFELVKMFVSPETLLPAGDLGEAFGVGAANNEDDIEEEEDISASEDNSTLPADDEEE